MGRDTNGGREASWEAARGRADRLVKFTMLAAADTLTAPLLKLLNFARILQVIKSIMFIIMRTELETIFGM